MFSRHVPVFRFASLIPALFQYVYGILANKGFLQEHASSSFLPHLIISLSFWQGWLKMIGGVTGYLAFILAIAGLIIAPKGLLKNVLSGLWIGYLFFGLSATYQMHTHSYYHMPFIPIAALSLGPIGSDIAHGLTKQLQKRWQLSVAFFLILIAITAVGAKAQIRIILMEHKKELKLIGAVTGINPEFKAFITGNYERELRTAKEIGEHVGHSTNTLFLTPHFGRVLTYFGELSGLPWPTSRSLYGRKLRGTRIPDINKDFNPEYVMIGYHGKYIKYTPDYFIVTDFLEYEKQSVLKDYLTNNFPLLVKSEEYLIFDMRKMSNLSG